MPPTPAVGMLITCLADTLRPQLASACLQLLEQTGIVPIIPQAQTCCGQPALNAGRRDDAKNFARQLAKQFSACTTVVAPSGSCIGAIKTHYPALFAPDDPGHEAVVDLANKCQELSQYLAAQKFTPAKQEKTYTLAFHDSCAGLRELGIKQGPRDLLTAAGHKLVTLANAEVCCGFGGTFAVKFGAVAGQMAENKCSAALASDAEMLVMGDLGCILNLEGRMQQRSDSIPVRHWAELLV